MTLGIGSIIGAVLGALIGGSSERLFDSLVGAAIAAAIVHAVSVYRRLDHLHAQVERLSKTVAQQRAATANTPPSPVTLPSPVMPPSPVRATAPAPAVAPAATAAPAAPAAPIVSPARPAPPSAPLNPLVAAAWKFMTGGNTVVRGGIIVLFFGVAFLLRYAAEHSHVPIEVRLAGVGAAATALLILGWRLRRTRAGYALALQGGAVGIWYLTTFAALRLYHVLPPTAAFVLLTVVVVLSGMLAVLQNSQSFALLAVSGGFLAPILASTGEGSHVALFSYYAILNAGILGVSWYKAWRPLNVVGFLFTFAVSTMWGVFQYRAGDFATTEPFLVLFFVFYVGIALLFTLRQPPQLRGYIDGTLIFGVPIAAFGLQTSMLHDRLFPLAYSALAMSAWYLVLAWLLQRRRHDTQRLLCEAFIALGVAFFTLAVPIALGSRLNSATWALEGSALLWVGCRQQRQLPRWTGAILILIAGGLLSPEFQLHDGQVRLTLGADVAIVLLAVAAVFAASLYGRYAPRINPAERPLCSVLFFWGLLWWTLGGLGELNHYLPPRYLVTGFLLFAAATALLSSEIQRRLHIAAAGVATLLLWPALLLLALGLKAGAVHTVGHPFANAGWAAWPLAFAALYVILRRRDSVVGPGSTLPNLAQPLHVSGAWLLIALAAWETGWQIAHAVLVPDGVLLEQPQAWTGNVWGLAGWATVPTLALFALSRVARRAGWPFDQHGRAYQIIIPAGLSVALVAWTLAVNVKLHGDSQPLPYVPLLNPLDVAQGFALLALWRQVQRPRGLVAALAFFWLNGILLRTLHQWAGVPFHPADFVASTLTQTSLTILWAIVAFASMLIATRRRQRLVWLVGAGLLAVVIAKLFFVDLSSSGSIERIVSFVGVGVLMLIVGYFSPLPPRTEP